MSTTDLKRMRLLCGLRQIDVSFCTGVSVSALSAAEQGRKPLNYVEHGAVVAFLRKRWWALQLAEAEDADVRGESINLALEASDEWFAAHPE